MKYIIFIIFTTCSQILNITTLSNTLSPACTPTHSSNSTTLSVGQCYEYLYYVEMEVGTPGQAMNFLIDITTSQLWLPNNEQYRLNGSSTVKVLPDQKNIPYHHDQMVQGYVGSDVVAVNDTPVSVRSGIIWPDQMPGHLHERIHGVLGMDHSVLPNFLDLAYDDAEITSSVFALNLTHSDNSLLYYNILPQAFIQHAQYAAVIHDSLWMVNVREVLLDEQKNYHAGQEAILDCRESSILLNEELYNWVKKEYFQHCNHEAHMIICPFTKEQNFPNITFLLEGFEVYLTPNNYRKRVGDHWMVWLSSSQGSQIILGNVFFTQYTIIFNKESHKVGLYGRTTPIYTIGDSYFDTVCQIFSAMLIFLLMFGVYLLYQLRLRKHKKKSNISPPVRYCSFIEH